MNSKTYINILKDTLVKKNEILDQLLDITILQEECFKNSPVDIDLFEDSVGKKTDIIEQLNTLDDGFDKVYKHVKNELIDEKDTYKEDVYELQESIKNIISKTTKLQALEIRNKKSAEAYFSSKKNDVKTFKISSQTASNYYKNMADQHQEGQSYFLDKKK
ncbi:MAG TPA: flagellar protein FlgN [Clostridiales bacterium]|nr:flagellar protein FlgN [Clostridiales bacterium]